MPGFRHLAAPLIFVCSICRDHRLCRHASARRRMLGASWRASRDRRLSLSFARDDRPLAMPASLKRFELVRQRLILHYRCSRFLTGYRVYYWRLIFDAILALAASSISPSPLHGYHHHRSVIFVVVERSFSDKLSSAASVIASRGVASVLDFALLDTHTRIAVIFGADDIECAEGSFGRHDVRCSISSALMLALGQSMTIMPPQYSITHSRFRLSPSRVFFSFHALISFSMSLCPLISDEPLISMRRQSGYALIFMHTPRFRQSSHDALPLNTTAAGASLIEGYSFSHRRKKPRRWYFRRSTRDDFSWLRCHRGTTWRAHGQTRSPGHFHAFIPLSLAGLRDYRSSMALRPPHGLYQHGFISSPILKESSADMVRLAMLYATMYCSSRRSAL